MKVILYMGMSLNGMVARDNYEEDFISDEGWNSFVELTKKAGGLIWGRKTFEVVKEWDKSYLNQLKGIRKIIVSRQNFELEDEYKLANSPKQALEILEKEGFQEVILCGGSVNNTSFAMANLIDEIIFNVEPVIIGKGMPVFFGQEFDLKLELKTLNKISENMIQLHYTVKK